MKSVLLYHHNTGEHQQHRWRLDRLLLMLQHYRPARAGRPDRSFAVGPKHDSIVISTAGPNRFDGQHAVYGKGGHFDGAMIFARLTFQDVRRILEQFYAGRPAARCFSRKRGRFEPYREPNFGSSDPSRGCRIIGARGARMMTAGPNDLEVMAFRDWTALVKYAEQHTRLAPVVLRTLVLDPVSVDPEDLADELDHLWDTKPPEPIAMVIASVLKALGDQGVVLSAREDKK